VTVDELIMLAQEIADVPVLGASATRLASGVLELLSTESTPCGLEEPRNMSELGGDNSVYIPTQYGGADLAQDHARWFATAVLRAAGAQR